jgi:hypothetical protein
MGGVCRMGKSEFKSGIMNGIHRLGDILEEDGKIFQSFLKVSVRWCGNMQWIVLRHGRAPIGWPL